MKQVERNKLRSSVLLLQLDDKELVRKAKEQLPYVTEAYEVLFHRYYNKLMQISFRYLGSAEEAEEVVNDTMLSMFNHLSRFEERASFKTWLYRIVHNHAMSRLRKRNAQTVELAEVEEIESEVTSESDDDFRKNEQINKWLNTLTLDERSIVVFRIAGDLEFKEIAQIMGKKLSAVKMRYKRALDKLPSSK